MKMPVAYSSTCFVLILSILPASEVALSQAAAPTHQADTLSKAIRSSSASDTLIGLWTAKRRFGPDARGPLVIERNEATLTGDFFGLRFPIKLQGNRVTFDLGPNIGSFDGLFTAAKKTIDGHWTAPRNPINGSRYLSRLTLVEDRPNRWRGEVEPLQATFTLLLKIEKQPDGSLGGYLRNPERNIGMWYNVERVEREGDVVKLMGKRFGQAGLVLQGKYDPDNDVISLSFPDRGGTYDLQRNTDSNSVFYARGMAPAQYHYHEPLARDDGWPVGSLSEEGISQPGIEKYIQMLIDSAPQSLHSPEIEGVLVARHGRLVLEEYFHGENRDRFHETRSAAKSVTAIIAGAAMQAGGTLNLQTPVYQVFYDGKIPDSIGGDKRAMTLENLLTMSSGYFCDDVNPEAPGNEDRMQDQTEEPDYYAYTLRLPMASKPGDVAVYCSTNANLALGLVGRVMKESPVTLFDRLVGTPMGITQYAWPLDPAGNPYGGGGVLYLPRDFMKFGQLLLNDGNWNGKRILSHDYVIRLSTPQYYLRNIAYGYLWWNMKFPYKNREVRCFYAGGNGGQTVVVIPELDLVIAMYGGYYSDRTGLLYNQQGIPDYILPCVREAGDDPNSPVVWKISRPPTATPRRQDELLNAISNSAWVGAAGTRGIN